MDPALPSMGKLDEDEMVWAIPDFLDATDPINEFLPGNPEDQDLLGTLMEGSNPPGLQPIDTASVAIKEFDIDLDEPTATGGNINFEYGLGSPTWLDTFIVSSRDMCDRMTVDIR